MKPTNPLYYVIPDHYALRRWWCSLFGHRFNMHQRVVDYTLTEVHHVICKTCYGVRKEHDICLKDSDASSETIDPREQWTKIRMHNKGLLVYKNDMLESL